MTDLSQEEIIVQLLARIKELELANDELAKAAFNVSIYLGNQNKKYKENYDSEKNK